eukprot:6208195-Amphidinium_carterae.1
MNMLETHANHAMWNLQILATSLVPGGQHPIPRGLTSNEALKVYWAPYIHARLNAPKFAAPEEDSDTDNPEPEWAKHAYGTREPSPTTVHLADPYTGDSNTAASSTQPCVMQQRPPTPPLPVHPPSTTIPTPPAEGGFHHEHSHIQQPQPPQHYGFSCYQSGPQAQWPKLATRTNAPFDESTARFTLGP